ncbi:hypothetical protein SDC9_184808 [bioreactor metagenome]|uniref:Uncharacterized protein n=1 Tax=bioreactor metagenome TaxID=1076179 RepID=A0A645HFY2_9ZZZZ
MAAVDYAGSYQGGMEVTAPGDHGGACKQAGCLCRFFCDGAQHIGGLLKGRKTVDEVADSQDCVTYQGVEGLLERMYQPPEAQYIGFHLSGELEGEVVLGL